MWQCVKCRESLGDDFEVCWNCGTSREGVEDARFRKADEISVEELDDPSVANTLSEAEQATAIKILPQAGAGNREEPPSRSVECLRCGCALKFLGVKSFGQVDTWVDALVELFSPETSFDVYACPRCGRAELFLSGAGREFRERETTE
jgi:hypothetical protein